MPAICEKCAGLAKIRGVKMNKSIKSTIKPVVDIFMTVLLLFLMGYQFWGETAHEWAGTLMLLLFIAHHILNAGWYKNIFRGRYTPVRIIMTVINLALLVTMLCLMGSGIMMSRHVFSFLSVSSGMGTARLVHMAACYWGFVLMSLHLGQNCHTPHSGCGYFSIRGVCIHQPESHHIYAFTDTVCFPGFWRISDILLYRVSGNGRAVCLDRLLSDHDIQKEEKGI